MDSRTIITIKEQHFSYPVCIEEGALSNAGVFIRDLLPDASKAFIVTDSNVAPLYLTLVESSLKKADFTVFSEIIPSGENFKTIDTVKTLYDQAIVHSIKRGDIVIALGGGITGDITGYFASTFQRGIPFINIPTTLLAQVDASVGGKTGINWNKLKNLVGAFYHPKGVLIDTRTLKTLLERDFACGLAEVVKYSLIEKSVPDRSYEPSLFSMLQQIPSIHNLPLKMIIERCCMIKGDVVHADPFERKGIREILNLGHTFAHAYETLSNGDILHGEAVSIGIVKAFNISELMGFIHGDITSKIKNILQNFNLPVESPCNFSMEQLMQAMCNDKKILAGKNIRLVLPYENIGKVRIQDDIPVEFLGST